MDAYREIPPPLAPFKPSMEMNIDATPEVSPPMGTMSPPVDQMDVDGDNEERLPVTYNPFEGRLWAKQNYETVFQFLNRLGPHDIPNCGGIIWIANPSAKPNESQDRVGFVKEGKALLSELEAAIAKIAPGSENIDEKIKSTREIYKQTVLELAKEKEVIRGKWEFFPAPAMVPQVWRLIAGATFRGQLGIASKIEENVGNYPKQTVVSVYTQDFNNVEEIKTIFLTLQSIRMLGAKQGGASIPYTCEAYSYLDICSGNRWGLDPYLYYSKDLLRAFHGQRVCRD